MRRLALGLLLASLPMVSGAEVLLDKGEVSAVLSHGPWPPEQSPDPSNHTSGDTRAIALGAALFTDPLLSRDHSMSCATCHDPARDFADGLARGHGLNLLDRNTPSLSNARFHRWFGWAGSSDNLWAQSLLPIMNPAEMGRDAADLKEVLIQSRHHGPYTEIFGVPADQKPETVLVNTGKVLAAYQETLVTGRTPFDAFRDALAAGDTETAARYPESAQRGLLLFLGRGNCALCHSGPLFSNGEFHDAGVPYFLPDNRVDAGRHGALGLLRQSPYTLDGAFSDDPDKTGAWAVRTVRDSHANFGIFRVPSLRNVARTSPFMHDGSISDLTGVVRHYNDINEERLHADGEAILQPIGLTEVEIADLVAFLESLSD